MVQRSITICPKEEQDFSQYSRQSHEHWRQLLQTQLANVEGRASDSFLQGLGKILPLIREIPNLNVLADVVYQTIGWEVWPVAGLLEVDPFFYLLSNRCFPISIVMESQADFTNSPVPGMWHDVFGHLPLLFFPPYANLTQYLAQQYLEQPSFQAEIASVFWYTMESGLCVENGDRRLYGATQLSRIDEIAYAVSDRPVVMPFDLETVMSYPVERERLQDRIFEIPSLEYLDCIPGQLDECLKTITG